MAGKSYRIPLRPDFRFVHEPHNVSRTDWFVGRRQEVEDLTRRLQYSDGGSFLVTGYRGVGKTSFVRHALSELAARVTVLDVYLSIARPLTAAELMHLIIRNLYERLHERKLYGRLTAAYQRELTLAYQRTSANVVRKLAEVGERGLEFGDLAIHGVKVPFAPKASLKSSRTVNLETSFLAYDDKAAEHDVISISRALALGIPRSEPWWSALARRTRGKDPELEPLKIVFVFDELDKLEEQPGELGGAEAQDAAANGVEAMLRNLKTLFTTSGICFVFIAGKDLHERWLADLWRGDGIYESVFSYDKYLPCMWTDVDQICSGLFGAGSGAHPGTAEERELVDIFRRYLRFKGRGTPRRLLRTFNEMVSWEDFAGAEPGIRLQNEELRRVKFFADLNATLEANEEALFGLSSDDMTGTRQDRRRLGIYYVVDWILRRGKRDFAVADLLTASRDLSTRVALAEEVAAGAVAGLLEVLESGKYIEVVNQKLDEVVLGTSAVNEKRYQLTARRLAEMSGIGGAAEPFSKPGDVGPYVQLELLGSGGMGTVYRALDTRFGKLVALKFLHSHFTHDEVLRQRFLSEIKILGSLRHRNIVNLLEVHKTASQTYLAMEFIDGVDLRLVIERKGYLSPELAWAILHPISEAIGFAHARGIVRLDVKPSNVQVAYTGDVYLMDLGIARHTADAKMTVTGSLLGTPLYMSPEQILDRPLDQRSDIYSFGAMFFHALTGSAPFVGNEMYKVIHMHVNAEAPRPSSRRAEIPAWLDEAVLRCLSKDPESRFQSMEELQKYMEAAPDFRMALPEEVAYTATTVRKDTASLEADRNSITRMATRMMERPPTRVFVPPSSAALNPEHTVLFPAPPAPPKVVSSPAQEPFAEPPNRPQAGPAEFTRLLAGMTPAPAPAEAAVRPRLTWIDPDGQEQSFALNLSGGSQIKIGRAVEGNDVVIDSEKVSRFHAAIVNEDEGKFAIEDLNSATGTYVNEERVFKRQLLHPADVLRFGSVLVTFWS